MAKISKGIKKNDSRVLISDILPYELPPTFSNAGFYRFAQRVNLSISDQSCLMTRPSRASVAAIKIIFSPTNFTVSQNNSRRLFRMDSGHKSIWKFTEPFQYSIRHKQNDFRTLTIPHPLSQLEIVNFYRKFESSLLFFTDRSSFSLRKPIKVAPYAIVVDRLFLGREGERDFVEEYGNEYSWLRSYFSYGRYSNVYKFYESRDFRQLETSFDFLLKLDIAKCFDSIYTHSIAWAAHGRSYVKSNLGSLKGTFGDSFDVVMRNMNHNETSGISIGSEASRLFAEVVLQALDVEIERKLDRRGIRSGIDFVILRYVDDYFVFLTDQRLAPQITAVIESTLQAYKLHLNPRKQQVEETPLASGISLAKHEFNSALSDQLSAGVYGEGHDVFRIVPRGVVEFVSSSGQSH